MKRLCLLLLSVFVLASCDSPERTVDTLRKQITSFKATPTDAIQLQIEQSFAKLDTQIDKLEASGKPNEASVLRRQESTLRSDYQAAKVAKTINDAKSAIQGIGESLKDVGRSIENVFQSTNDSN